MIFIVPCGQQNLCLVGGGCVFLFAGQRAFPLGNIASVCSPKKLLEANGTE